MKGSGNWTITQQIAGVVGRGTRALPMTALALLVSCDSSDRSRQSATSPVRTSASPTAIVSRMDFEKRGLKWPLAVEEASLGCTDQSRWVHVDGKRYALNGTAKGHGYAPLEPIWAVDRKMAEMLEKAGAPNEPPLRVSVGDMIEEAGKLC